MEKGIPRYKPKPLDPQCGEKLGVANLRVVLAVDATGKISAFSAPGVKPKRARFPIKNVEKILAIKGINLVSKEGSPATLIVCYPTGGGDFVCFEF